MKEITFRWLRPDEYPRIEAVCKEHDWAVPHPEAGSIRVAELEGRIVAFVCVELFPNLGPGWIDPEFRHSRAIWDDALQSMYELLQPRHIFPGMIFIAESKASERIAERLGLKRIDSVLYVKEWRDGQTLQSS